MVEISNGASPASIQLTKKESLIRTRNTETKSNAAKRTMFDSLNNINKFNVSKRVSFEGQSKFASAPISPVASGPTSPTNGYYDDATGTSTKVSFRDAAHNGIRSSGFNPPL